MDHGAVPSKPFGEFKRERESLPEEGMMLDADLPESFCSSVVVQLEANGALKLLILRTGDILSFRIQSVLALNYYQASMTSQMALLI